MSSRRCPTCGGLVAVDAAWCGQCLARLDEPPGGPRPEAGDEESAPPSPAGPVGKPRPAAPGQPGRTGATASASPPGERAGPGPGALRAEGGDVLWSCPTCGRENPLQATECGSCGTPFGRLLEDSPPARPLAGGRLLSLSLLFPGAGHVAGGRVAEGLARAVVFGFALGTAVAVVVARRGLGLGPFLPLVAILLLAGAILYGMTAADAGRLARGLPPLLSTRILLYSATGLMLLTVVVLVVSGLRVSGP